MVTLERNLEGTPKTRGIELELRFGRRKPARSGRSPLILAV